MNAFKHLDPVLEGLLRIFGVISALGFLYCGVLLLGGADWIAPEDTLLYLMWFGVSTLSVVLMLQDDHWGAYSLALGTLAISIFEIVRGTATLGGASLGLLVLIVVITYLRNPSQNQSSQSNA